MLQSLKKVSKSMQYEERSSLTQSDFRIQNILLHTFRQFKMNILSIVKLVN